MTRYDYTTHWYAALFPDLPVDEYEKLKEDVRLNGQLHPVVIDGNTLLDGRHRMKVARELGITPYTVLFRDVHNVRAEMTAEDFIDSVNLHRRHLSDDQRAQLAVSRAEGLQRAAKEQQKRKPVLVKTPKQNPIHTRKALAAQTKLPENKIRKAQELDAKAPELVPEVTAGKLTLRQAHEKAGLKKPKAVKRFVMAGFIGEILADLDKRLKKIPDDHVTETKNELKEMLTAWLRNLGILEPRSAASNLADDPDLETSALEDLAAQSRESESVDVLEFKRFCRKACCRTSLKIFTLVLAASLYHIEPFSDSSGAAVSFEAWANCLRIVRQKKEQEVVEPSDAIASNVK